MKKLVAITGASTGIGAALAKQMSADGHPLLLMARRVQNMLELGLPNTLCEQVDVTDYASVERAIRRAEAQYGGVDLLVNNAGALYLEKSYDQDYAQWAQMIDVNIKGILTGTHVVIKDMMARGGGTIINLGSIAGRKLHDNHTVYCGTKHAVHAITEGMRKEVAGRNVRVIVIAPGLTDTEILEHTTNMDITQAYAKKKEALGGFLSPQAVVDCITFAYNQPQDVCIREIVVTKTIQA